MKSQFHTCKVNKVTFCPSNPSGTSLERENESVRLTPHNPPQDSHSLYSFAKKKKKRNKATEKKISGRLEGPVGSILHKKKNAQIKKRHHKEGKLGQFLCSFFVVSFLYLRNFFSLKIISIRHTSSYIQEGLLPSWKVLSGYGSSVNYCVQPDDIP